MRRVFLKVLILTVCWLVFLTPIVCSQRIKQLPGMYSADIEGYGVSDYEFGKTYCVNFTSNKRVCKGYKTGDGSMHFIVQKNEKTIRTWTHPPGVGNGTGNFHVFYGDLDRDSFKELIVVSNVNTTSGMMVSSANAYILSGPIEEDFGEPVVFGLQEFGENDHFFFDHRRRETLILITEWNGYSTLDPKRGGGSYLVGRWFRYKNGQLSPALDKPILARRYLFSFERERWDTFGRNEWKHRPYLWLKHPTTHKFYREPKDESPPTATLWGTIEAYEETTLFDNYESTRKFRVRLDSGEVLVCSTGFPLMEYEREKPEWQGVISISSFGLLPQRIRLPAELSPKTLFHKVEGRRIRIETYRDEYSQYHRFWFLAD